MSFEDDVKIIYKNEKPYWKYGSTELLISQEVLSKLKYYYDTPIFDTYCKCLRTYPLDVPKQKKESYYYVQSNGIITKIDVMPNVYKDLPNGSSTIDCLTAFRYLDEAPYFVNKLEPTNQNILSLLIFLEGFWKKSLDNIPNISKNVSQNYDVQNKFVTMLQAIFDVKKEAIDTLLLRDTDVQYLCSLVAAGFLTIDN